MTEQSKVWFKCDRAHALENRDDSEFRESVVQPWRAVNEISTSRDRGIQGYYEYRSTVAPWRTCTAAEAHAAPKTSERRAKGSTAWVTTSTWGCGSCTACKFRTRVTEAMPADAVAVPEYAPDQEVYKAAEAFTAPWRKCTEAEAEASPSLSQVTWGARNYWIRCDDRRTRDAIGDGNAAYRTLVPAVVPTFHVDLVPSLPHAGSKILADGTIRDSDFGTFGVELHTNNVGILTVDDEDTGKSNAIFVADALALIDRAGLNATAIDVRDRADAMIREWRANYVSAEARVRELHETYGKQADALRAELKIARAAAETQDRQLLADRNALREQVGLLTKRVEPAEKTLAERDASKTLGSFMWSTPFTLSGDAYKDLVEALIPWRTCDRKFAEAHPEECEHRCPEAWGEYHNWAKFSTRARYLSGRDCPDCEYRTRLAVPKPVACTSKEAEAHKAESEWGEGGSGRRAP